MSTHVSKLSLLNEISSVRCAGDILRNRAPLIQQWPWENGIVLQRGSMAEKMREGINDETGAFELMVLVSHLLIMSFQIFLTAVRNSRMH